MGLTSVINLSLTSNMLSEHLSTMSGSGAYFQYPGIGVPVLAVYRGTTSGDKEIKIGLGDVVQGSQLGGVNLSCTISSAGLVLRFNTKCRSNRVHFSGALYGAIRGQGLLRNKRSYLPVCAHRVTGNKT